MKNLKFKTKKLTLYFCRKQALIFVPISNDYYQNIIHHSQLQHQQRAPEHLERSNSSSDEDRQKRNLNLWHGVSLYIKGEITTTYYQGPTHFYYLVLKS